jgi:VanZ family protein
MHQEEFSKRTTYGRWILFLTSLWLVFICFGSWYPFDIRMVTLREAVWRWAGSWSMRNAISDRVLNFALGVPTGLLICALISPATWGKRDHRRRLWIIEAVFWLICCCLTAVVVEIGQVFYSWRFSSLQDSILQIAGSVLGGISYLLLERRFFLAYSITKTFFEKLTHASQLAIALVFINLIFQFWPFIPSISPSELKHKLREIKITVGSDEFSILVVELLSSRAGLLYVLLSGLTWLLMGFFLADIRGKSNASMLLKIIGVVSIMTLSEILKLFVDGRTPSATNWSVSVLGLSSGMLLYRISRLVKVNQ